MKGRKSSGTRDLFLALAVLAGELAGPVLCAATVLQTGRLLSGWLEKIYVLSGGVLALGFLTISLCLGGAAPEKGFRKIKRDWLDVLKPELWLTAMFLLWRLFAEVWTGMGRGLVENELLYLGVLLLSVLAGLFAAVFPVNALMRKCGREGAGKGFLRGLLAFGLLLFGTALLAAAFWGKEQAMSLWEPSMIGMLASHVFLAYCEYWILRLLLAVLGRGKKAHAAGDTGAETVAEAVGGAAESAPEGTAKNAAGNTAEGAGAPKAGGNRGRSFVGAVIPLVLALLLFWLPGALESSASVPELVEEALETPLKKGYLELEEGNLEQALAEFARADARVRAFGSLTGAEEGETLESVYREYSGDEIIGILYFSGGESLQALENGIISNVLDSRWYPALLRYYGETKKLSRDQKSLQRELLLWCAAREKYTAEKSYIFAEDVEDNRLAVRRLLGEYGEMLDDYSLFEFLVRYNREGGCTEELAYEALEKAEEKPEDMLLQYLACLMGSGFQEDGARHYTRTVEAAARFDALYDQPGRKDEQVARVKRFLGDVAAKCYDFETALAYYEASYALSGDSGTALDCAEISEKLQDYETCALMAGQVLEEEADNTQALYLLSISSLKTGDVDGALDAAGRLGDLLADKSRTVDAAEENNLYVCAQYFSMRDKSDWTDYRWEIYSSLSDRQKRELQSHELLWNYMTAIHLCFERGDYEAAQEAAEKVLAIREDLRMGWYLKGTIAFSAKEFDKALEAFQKAESLGSATPALYFSIANTYDALEDYENAWLYTRRVEELLPYQDHGNDVYGISIHNGNLLRALENKLGR